ncbi:aromatic ring-hydroxylating oxygenase subunit alpha [Microbacterium atlanticum]|uniref:aromatic ring-hydroxylating oxygenase subunit alpha n=1 Tax=Microbacterium atlanticum TaxID=2782168 RepID=UPI001888F6E3|nr:Rieske (2Fe-2S) protein [Microbacterium atlanticum]
METTETLDRVAAEDVGGAAEVEFARAVESVWRPRWLLAGHIDQLAKPGAFLTIALGDRDAVIRKDADGQVHAFYNVCPHRGARLCEGRTGAQSPRAIMCPYHGWTFTPAGGELMKAPYMHDDFDLAGWKLYPVHARLFHGLVMVSFADDRPASTESEAAGDAVAVFGRGSWSLAQFSSEEVAVAWPEVVEGDALHLDAPGLDGAHVSRWEPASIVAVGAEQAAIRTARPTGAGTTQIEEYWFVRESEGNHDQGEVIGCANPRPTPHP